MEMRIHGLLIIGIFFTQPKVFNRLPLPCKCFKVTGLIRIESMLLYLRKAVRCEFQ